MHELSDKVRELLPAASVTAVTNTGVFHVSTLINLVLFLLLVVQLGYVTWKWHKDYKDRKDK